MRNKKDQFSKEIWPHHRKGGKVANPEAEGVSANDMRKVPPPARLDIAHTSRSCDSRTAHVLAGPRQPLPPFHTPAWPHMIYECARHGSRHTHFAFELTPPDVVITPLLSACTVCPLSPHQQRRISGQREARGVRQKSIKPCLQRCRFQPPSAGAPSRSLQDGFVTSHYRDCSVRSACTIMI
jgi:hypothetical protein